MQTELQNAYAVSNMDHNGSDAQVAHQAAIAAVVAAGLVAVVRCDVAYCPSTDAVLSNPHVRLVAALPSYREAECLMCSLTPDYWDGDGETQYVIKCAPELRPDQGLLGKTVYPKPVDKDELPF